MHHSTEASRPACGSRQPSSLARPLALAATCVLSVVMHGCDGIPRLDIEPQGHLVTTESGRHVDIQVSLYHSPNGVIRVTASSSDESEGKVEGEARFDSENWREPQTFRVTGVDDAREDGDKHFDVAFYATNSASKLGPKLIRVLHFINRDDDTARFVALGDLPGGEFASTVYDVSSDGQVVVGFSIGSDGDEAVRWTEATGLQGLGGPQSQAHSISPDGRRIVGSIADDSYQGGRAGVLWQEGEPFVRLTGASAPAGGPPMFLFVDGTVALNSGLVYGTCIQYGAYGDPLRCRWDPPMSLTALGLGHVYAADEGGSYAGDERSERHAPLKTWAVADGARLPYPEGADCSSPISGCMASVRAFSRDRTFVGTANVPKSTDTTLPPVLYETAWFNVNGSTAESAAQRLPDLDGGEDAAGAYAIDAAGRVIAGFGSDGDGKQAVLWIEGAIMSLEDVFRAHGGKLPEGFVLREVRAMSADGRTFVGNGLNAAKADEGFRIQFSGDL